MSDKNTTHLAGEYFVAAELAKREFQVALTMGNAKAIDLLAGRDARAVSVQVKAIRNRKSVGWPIWKRQVLRDIIYVFVCLNRKEEPPSYFVCTPDEARSLIVEYPTRSILTMGKIKAAGHEGRWDKIDSALSEGRIDQCPQYQSKEIITP